MERKDVNRIDWKDKEGGGRRGDKYKLLNCCRKSQGRAATTLVLVRPEWLCLASETKRTLAVSITLSLSMFLLLLFSLGVYFQKGLTKQMNFSIIDIGCV